MKKVIIIFLFIIIIFAAYAFYENERQNSKYFIYTNDYKPSLSSKTAEYDKLDCSNDGTKDCIILAEEIKNVSEKIANLLTKEDNFYDQIKNYEYEEINSQDANLLKKESNSNFVDSTLEKYKEMGFDIEYFKHGKIEAILDDGGILFTDNTDEDLYFYDTGYIFKAPCDNDVKKAKAVLNKDGFIDGIYQIDNNCETYYYIGRKKFYDRIIKSYTGREKLLGYDYANRLTLNDDKTAFAFFYSYPHEASLLSAKDRSRSNFLAYQDISEIRTTMNILDTLTDKGLEVSEKILEINEKFEKSIVTNTLNTLLPKKITNSGIEPEEMYDIVIGNETNIYNKLMGKKTLDDSENSEEEEMNTNSYTFETITMYDKDGKRYPTGSAIPEIYKMCWIGNDLYFRADIDPRTKVVADIYTINFEEVDSRKEPKLILTNDPDDRSKYYYLTGCSSKFNRLYIESSGTGKFGYLDLDTKDITYIFDGKDITNLRVNNELLSFVDEFENNYILELN